MREKLTYLFVHQPIDNPTDPRVETQFLDYDANGNITHIERAINNPEQPIDESRESVRKFVWDEEDRLLGVDLRPESDRGQPHIAAYTYDASGERGIRYVPRQQEGVSSGATSGYAQDMDIMLYPNALITVRPQELPEDFDPMHMHPEHTFTTYTKHYYIGSERINSKLGTVNNLGLLCEEMEPSTDLINEMNDRANGANKWLEKLYHYLDKELEIDSPYLYSANHSLVCGFKAHDPKMYDAYWYHPDHLGSSSFITNTTGEISQHIEYLPFGETLVEEHLNSYNSPFKFNAKEYDAETGNYYYGARYLNPKWNIFLTPDPALESYPGISPYAYTLNNPVRYVDPTGMFVESRDDDYYINANGVIEVTKTNDNFDRFFLKSTGFDGKSEHTTLVEQFDKNENGLIQLPSNFSFSNSDFNVDFSFSVKEGNEYRSFIRGDAFASLIGTLATTNTTDLTVIGFSLSDGSSPAPSVSHKNGINGDLRYLRTDQSGAGVLLGQSAFDMDRQNTFNNTLNRFGWTDMLSERFTPSGKTGTSLLNHTRHYNKSRHHNHLHLQGYKPKLIYNSK